MVKFLLLFVVSAFVLTHATAQTNCSSGKIYGLWKECGIVRSESYTHPPAGINTDSIRKAFPAHNTTDKTWRFNTDGTFLYEMPAAGIKDKGHFSVVENDCLLKLSSRKRSPLHIVYIDDSCMILWQNNPKTAYLTVYRR